ncbi:MAG: hypothetical protein ACP5D2_04055 [Candidatus Nanoarchaeia archaeon]
MEKRGQVTLFIIIAIMIVIAIALFFLWVRPTYMQEGGELSLERCVQSALEKHIQELGLKGGFINPELTYAYQGEDITYYCYTEEYHQAGIVQVAFPKKHFEENLELAIKEDVSSCYEQAISELQAEGYDVQPGEINLDVNLFSNQVELDLEAPTSVTGQQTRRYETFKINEQSNIYDLLMIATSILQQETHYGDSDVSSMMMFYPDITIRKKKQSDGTTIYIIEDGKTKLQFASRSYIWPAGYGI